MFEYLAPFRVIVVTGPPRSGTTIAGHMIAADTGKRYYDDIQDGMSNIYNIRRIISKDEGAVIQCPFASWYADELGRRENVAVVFMIRSVDDIRTSAARCASFCLWPYGYGEYKRQGFGRLEAIYQHWFTAQKQMIVNPFNVNYESLRNHPLWVDKEQRVESWGGKTWQLPILSEV